MRSLVKAVLLSTMLAAASFAGQRAKEETGAIKGKVRVESGAGAVGVAIVAERAGREEMRVNSDRKGEFALRGLTPGFYKLTFRKPGLSVATIEQIEVRAGKERALSDRLIMSVDEGTLAFVRGSVFAPDGRSIRGASVELSQISASGEAKKIDGRMTGETGEFAFRLPPDRLRYRVTVKLSGREPLTKDVDVDGPAVYRVALSFSPTTAAK